MAMANFFSKYLGEFALMATAVLWTGCGNVDKDSKNEKSVSSASDSFGVAEVSNLKDSLNTNSPTVVLVDFGKLNKHSYERLLLWCYCKASS